MRRPPIVNKISRINQLARRVTNKTMEKVGERIALTKSWVLDKLVENVKKAMTLKSRSSVANRALELGHRTRLVPQ